MGPGNTDITLDYAYFVVAHQLPVDFTHILQDHPFEGIILCMCPANERWRYSVTPSLIGWAHAQNDPCFGTHKHSTASSISEATLKNMVLPLHKSTINC